MNNQKLKPIPEVGKFYHFFDNGKFSPGRHYICKVEEVVKYDDAKDIIIKDISVWDNDKGVYHKKSNTLIDCWCDTLIDCWLKEKKCNNWIYAPITDYFVEVSCPKYDKYNLWFARTKDGGWYSLDIQSGWQSGQLDVTGEIYDNIIKYWKESGYDISSFTNAKYK